MPQDSLRSVVYRSLVTCNDPNGVVEYGTMRKSKSELRKKEKKVDKLGAQGDLIESSAHKEKGLFSQDVKQGTLPPFEILEVSKGAQRLNLMIDSWAKGFGFDGNESKDIARDLLKGALDLQESLAMFCNLQETSKHFGPMENEHNHKYKRGILDDADGERTDSGRFTDKHQPPRDSFDGSTRSSAVELKKVIRDSLARQNLLSVSSEQEEDAYFTRGRKNFDVFTDIPSTSSSQSSTAQSNNSTSMDWSVSSMSKEMRTKSPNVIAKLMGLEDFPSPTSPSRIKQPDSKQSSVHRRLITDIEMPNVRNVHSISRKKDPQRKTLKEVIDTMHLKGLLKGNDVEGIALRSHNRRYSLPGENEEIPPIVLIKPLIFPRKEKGSLSSFRSLEVRGDSLNDLSSLSEGALEAEEMCNKVEPRRELPTSMSIQNNKALKLKSKEKPIRRSIQQERNSSSDETKRKPDPREQKSREKAYANNKVRMDSVPVIHKPEEKGTRIRRSDEVKVVLSNRKMQEEKRNEKPIEMSGLSSQDAATSIKSRKLYSSQLITRDPIQRQESTARNPISIRSRQSKVETSPGQAKNNAVRTTKPVKESMTTTQMTKRSQSKQHSKERDQIENRGSVSAVISNDPEDQQPTVEDTETTITPIEGQDKGSNLEEQGSFHLEVGTENCRQLENNTESTEEPTKLLDQEVGMKETAKTKINLKAMLSSTSSFLERAEYLFELHMNQPILLSTFSEDATSVDTRLMLDCAGELLESKTRRMSPIGHSLLWIHTINLRTSISLDQLLDEVCEDFDKLNNYTKLVNDIHKMVECDIRCKGSPAAGAWEIAWENEFSVKEAEQVSDELEKQVLSELIEEIIVDYSYTLVQHL